MALWVQELQVIHYCSSASRMAIENTDQRKNCKKQGPDPAAPCMPCQGNWNLSIPWWEALKFWREKQDEIRKVTPWSKEKKELGRIWKVTSPTKRQIGRGLFFLSFMMPSLPPAPHSFHTLLTAGPEWPPYIRFLCGKEITHSSLWLQVTTKTNWCMCKKRYKYTNFSPYKELYN